MNSKDPIELIDNIYSDFKESIESILEPHPQLFRNIVNNYDTVVTQLKTRALSDTSYNLNEIEIKRSLLSSQSETGRNYFTITSKESFNSLNTDNSNHGWGKALIYSPLNDHSRQFLRKGDVLFCYRLGQFENLNEALDTRGIYSIGIAATDPVELFPALEKHNKWAILVTFPLKFPEHLDLRNIQLNPTTISLTPYNGNRNDALQHIPDINHYTTLTNLMLAKNKSIKEQIKHFFSDLNLTNIELPIDIHKVHKKAIDNSLQQANDSIAFKFVEWINNPDNFKKSYDGLLTVKIINFWNESFFDNNLFRFDSKDIEGSIQKIELLISDPNNTEWIQYSNGTSKGAPAAIIGKNNYIKFLRAYLSSDEFQQSEEIYRPKQSFTPADFHKYSKYSGLEFSFIFIQRFIASLLTKPFVICSGLSGSGKTKLAQAFVQWISENENQYKIIPVGADWTNREPLLGYPNGLDPKSYVTPDSGALQLMIEANSNGSKPYFLILDEMNLSHVERYFADFLSIMESGDSIKLYSGADRMDSANNPIPREIGWPKNLFIIGTVNIDETTYMFSPKVLDRANVIEFRITPEEMKNFFNSNTNLDMNKLFVDGDKSKGGLGQDMGESFFQLASEKAIVKIPEIEGEHNILNKFFVELQNVGSEFGYRSAMEMELLITKLGLDCLSDENGSPLENNVKIDIAIMQKLLPKVHGSRKKLVLPLETLAGFCLKQTNQPQVVPSANVKSNYQQYLTDKGDKSNWTILYPISFEKIERMYKNVIDNGFTSYAEA